MYLSPFDSMAYYDDSDEERKTIEATCSHCGEPMQAWFAGISRYSTEPIHRGFCEACGDERRARTT